MADDAQPLPAQDEAPRADGTRGRVARPVPDQAPGNQRLATIPSRAVCDRLLSDRALRVLTLVGIWGNKHGWCWPSVARMAERMGCSERHVQRGLAELHARGYLERHPQGPYPNMMRIVFDAGDAQGVTDQSPHSLPPRRKRGDRAVTPSGTQRGDRSVTPSGAGDEGGEGVDNSERGDSVCRERGDSGCHPERIRERSSLSGEICPAAPRDPAKAAKKAAWQQRMCEHIRRTMPDAEAEALVAAFLANQADAVAAVNRLSRSIQAGARRQHQLALGVRR